MRRTRTPWPGTKRGRVAGCIGTTLSQPLDGSCRLLRVPVRRRFRPADGEPLHHVLDLAGCDRPLTQQALLEAPQPALEVGGREVVDRVHLLASRAAAGSRAQMFQLHQQVQGEDTRLPALVVRRLATRRDHRAEPVHTAQIVDAVHQPPTIAPAPSRGRC